MRTLLPVGLATPFSELIEEKASVCGVCHRFKGLPRARQSRSSGAECGLPVLAGMTTSSRIALIKSFNFARMASIAIEGIRVVRGWSRIRIVFCTPG